MTQLPTGWSYESINSIVEGGMIADGDWVESLSALVEEADGELRLIDWHEVMLRWEQSQFLRVEKDVSAVAA